MKRIIQHPPRPAKTTLWRSPRELENSPEFEEILQQEFPRGAGVYEDSGLSRRDFVKLLGASMALAGITGCRRPEAYLVPLKEGVEWAIPGKFLYYATSMPTRVGAMPLIATTTDGRPTKVEGNPLHPASNGGTDGFAQASVLDLYDPHRSKEIKKAGQSVTREELAAFLTSQRERFAGKGQGLAFLVERTHSPTRERLRKQLEQQFPGLIWAEYEPLGADEAIAATSVAFGPGMRLLPNFEKADVILALDSDFLNASQTGVGFASGFYPRRSPDQSMNRLYVAESTYSLTGGMADHRLRVKASQIGALATAVAAKVKDSMGAIAGFDNLIEAAPASPLNVDQKWIDECANDLVAHAGRSMVLVGSQQPAYVQALGMAINEMLGNYGETLQAIQLPPVDAASINDLAAAIQSKAVETLFILGGNPAYNAPADLNFSGLLGNVKNTVRLGLFEDETSAACQWHVPAAHYLESWGDALALDGTYTAVQPMILPLWDGIPELDFLHELATGSAPTGPELIQATFRETAETDNFDAAWSEFLRTGFLKDSAAPVTAADFNVAAATNLISQASPASAEGTELVFLASSSVDDGRYANNSWLLETPDFITKVTWDNAALVSKTTAENLGIKDGDVLEISAGGTTVQAGALITAGQADDSIAIALGYGRKGVSALMENVGFNAYPLRGSQSQRFRTGVTAKKTGEKYKFALTQEQTSIYGRDLVREGTIETYRDNPQFPRSMAEDGHLPPIVADNISLYTNIYLDAPEQWAMAVDLNTCIGCNACVVACQAENNVPVVGKDQVIKGRDMAWIRIDRWFASPEGSEENPEMLAQMITCQHCENAPCETVCPVNATVHSEDGLNLMAYNRCIGTRYCANNCPWKVRRFNYFDYNQRPIDELYWGPLAKKGMAESLKMVKNPNVTVRMRGVMEKCTFCIQRIEEAKIARTVQAGARNKNEVPVPAFKVACQQACPSDCITFGNERDPNSKVAKLRNADRGYVMLKYLNARPRITYLARVKNPNPKMPGAELVGKINSNHAHGHGGGHDDHNHKNGHGAEKAHGQEANLGGYGPSRYDVHGSPEPTTAGKKS